MGKIKKVKYKGEEHRIVAIGTRFATIKPKWGRKFDVRIEEILPKKISK